MYTLITKTGGRRNLQLVDTFQSLAFDAAGRAESAFAGHRLIVAHDLG